MSPGARRKPDKLVDVLKRRAPLLPPRDQPYQLEDVHESIADGCREALVLQWQDAHLVFHAEPDTDTLEAEFHEDRFQPSPGFLAIGTTAPWATYHRQECGWSWLAVNSQGYCSASLTWCPG